MELLSIARETGAPLSLKEIGFREEDLDRAADLALERQYPNPAPITLSAVRGLLEAAFRGDGDYITNKS